MKTNKNLEKKIFAALAASSIAFSSIATTLPASAGKVENQQTINNAILQNGAESSRKTRVYEFKVVATDKKEYPAIAYIDHKNHALVIKTEAPNIAISAKGQKRLAERGINKIASTVPVVFEGTEKGWHESDWRGYFERYVYPKAGKFLSKFFGIFNGAQEGYKLYATKAAEQKISELKEIKRFRTVSVFDDDEKSESEMEEIENEMKEELNNNNNLNNNSLPIVETLDPPMDEKNVENNIENNNNNFMEEEEIDETNNHNEMEEAYQAFKEQLNQQNYIVLPSFNKQLLKIFKSFFEQRTLIGKQQRVKLEENEVTSIGEALFEQGMVGKIEKNRIQIPSIPYNAPKLLTAGTENENPTTPSIKTEPLLIADRSAWEKDMHELPRLAEASVEDIKECLPYQTKRFANTIHEVAATATSWDDILAIRGVGNVTLQALMDHFSL